jgi:hypothetical protein
MTRRRKSKKKLIARGKAIKEFKKKTPLRFTSNELTFFATGFNMGWDSHKKEVKE